MENSVVLEELKTGKVKQLEDEQLQEAPPLLELQRHREERVSTTAPGRSWLYRIDATENRERKKEDEKYSGLSLLPTSSLLPAPCIG